MTHREIAEKLAEEYQIQVSQPVIGQLLKKHHYRRRKAQKNEPGNKSLIATNNLKILPAWWPSLRLAPPRLSVWIPRKRSIWPPYCSKYNPIEHRLFPHVTRACQGVVFKSVELVKDLMAKTKTAAGLSVTVNIIDKVYETGRKATDQFIEKCLSFLIRTYQMELCRYPKCGSYLIVDPFR